MLIKAVLLAILFFLPSEAFAQQLLPGQAVILTAKNAIEETLDRSDGSIYQVEGLTRLPENIVLPDGILDLTPSLMGKVRYGQPMQVQVAVNINGLRQMNIVTVWRVKKLVEVVVAAKDLQSRTALSEDDVTLERREVTRIDEAIFQISDAAGLELKRAIPAGSMVTRSSLTKPEIIRSGDNVTIVSISGSVTVKASGQALQGGAAGDVIRVRNISSGKSLLGRIEDRQTVVILG